MKKIITTIFILLVVLAANAQTNVIFNIEHLLKDKGFRLNQAATTNTNTNFSVSRLQYYISNISIIHDGGTVTPATGVYILVDAVNDVIQDLGSYNVTTIEGIKFSIGVNQPVNNQDPTKWPSNHPLSPQVPSMHWGWQAGYRFVAMEGKEGANLSNGFELHALGNNYYYDIQIPLSGQDIFGQQHITLKADYTRALENINIVGGKIVHGEETETIDLLRNFRDFVFTSQTGASNVLASVNNVLAPAALDMYPNPSNGTVSFDITDKSVNITSIQISDITGKVVENIAVNDFETAQTTLTTQGVYIVSLMNGTNSLLTKKLVIQ